MSWIKALVAVVTALVSVAATASASHALPVWDTSPVQVTRNVKPTPKVVDLRVGEHRNFDRVVIDLAGKVPGYTVKYTRMLTYEGSGEAVPLKGRKFMSIALFPARAHNAQVSTTDPSSASTRCQPCAASPSPVTTKPRCHSG